jgi:outer membrane protein
MKTIRGCAAVVLAAAAWAAPLDAQAPDTTFLTLDDALRVAAGGNPTYRQAVNTLGLKGAETRTVWFDQVLPRAELTLFDTYFWGNLTRRATDNFGNPIDNPVSDWTYFSQTNQALNLTWRVQGASIFNALSGQRLTNLDRDLGEEQARTALGISVRRAYWDVLEQRELLRAEEELVEARRVDQDVAERLFGLAMRTRVDVLNAELAVEQQALALRQQQAEFEKAKLRLLTTLGDEDLAPIRLEDPELPIFDPGGLDAESLVRMALDVNPEVRRADVAVRTAGTGLKQSRQAWWPTLVFNYNLARRAQTPQGDALFDVSFDEDLDQRFFIGLEVPAFNNFFQNQQSVQQAAVELDNRLEAERETTLRIGETVRAALLELENQWESVRLAERSAEIAAEALRLAREEYRIGTRTFEDLRQIIDEEAGTRRQVIQARHSFVDALLSLEEAVGAPVGPTGAGPGGGR